MAEADWSPEVKKNYADWRRRNWLFVFSCAAFNLIRIPKLLSAESRETVGPTLDCQGTRSRAA